jgi:hypothetical protein
MAQKIKLVQGDTYPQIRVTLTDENSGDPIDLTGATVTLHFRAAGGATLLFSRGGFVNPATATQGIAIFIWQEGDLNVPAGEYEGEVEIYWSNTGARQTVYDLLKFRVREDIG